MATANVVHTINAPIEQVFSVISDHANYQELSGVSHSALIAPGESDRNGVGAIRDLTASGARFTEEITHFEPPYRMDYHVIECYFSISDNALLLRFPIIHREGRIDIRETNGGTEITWVSRFGADLPFGNQVAKLMRPSVEKAFQKILVGIEQKLFSVEH